MDDLISRQDAIAEIKSVYEWHDVVTLDRLIEHLNQLPPAQPQRKGRWINIDDIERDLGATCFAKRTDDGELIALCSLDVYADMREESNEGLRE